LRPDVVTHASIRRIFFGLALLSIAGTAIELAMERHWGTTLRLVPWGALAFAVVALALAGVRPSGGSIRLARALALVILGASLFGIYEHVRSNYNAGPLDYRYATKWDSMSEPARWLRAATKTVGPSPILAPGILAQAALFLVLATWGPGTAAHTRQREESEGGNARR
jgi:hypothetical protein